MSRIWRDHFTRRKLAALLLGSALATWWMTRQKKRFVLLRELFPKFTHQVTWIEVDGERTRFPYFTNKALDGESTKTVFVIVPGNPGVAGLYLPFADHLRVKHPKAQIYALYHPFHCSLAKGDSRTDNYCDTVKLHIAFMAQVLSQRHPDSQFIYVGHSIGALISLRVMKAHQSRVNRVLMCMPTIHDIHLSPRASECYSMFRWRKLIYIFLRIVLLLPRSLLHRLVSFHFPSGIVYRKEITSEVIHEFNCDSYRNMLTMGKQEMDTVRDIKAEGVKQLVNDFACRLAVVSAEDDVWVIPQVQQSFRQACPNVKSITISKGVIDHAFMLTKGRDGSKFMAERCCELLNLINKSQHETSGAQSDVR